MTTDRELLELAALAAGYDIYAAWSALGAFDGFRLGSLAGATWSPLEDDGDALRLAVKLSLDVSFLHEAGGINEHCRLIAVDSGGPWTSCVREDAVTDPTAATRRAIVRAAAAIGAQKQEGG